MKRILPIIYMFFLLGIMASCSVNKFLAEDEYLLDKVEVETDNKAVKAADLALYVRQNPNTRWFNLLKVPMGIYALAGTDTTKRANRFWQRLGDAPVIFSPQRTEESREQLLRAVRNQGYFSASVAVDTMIQKKKIKVKYRIKTGEPYKIASLRRVYHDEAVGAIIEADSAHTLLHKGGLLDVNVLDSERNRLTKTLQKQGYFAFNKEYIGYQADTVRNDKGVELTMQVNAPRAAATDTVPLPHQTYRLRQIHFLLNTDSIGGEATHLDLSPFHIYSQGKPYLRKGVLLSANRMLPDTLYNVQMVEETYAALGRLDILRSYNVRFREEEKNVLDAYILMTKHKNKAISFEVEGTNSAGDLGVAASVGFTHRNLFKGSEVFKARLRGAYEAVSGLEGYTNSNYKEYSIETSLTFPDFRFPFLSRAFKRRIHATSEVSAKFNSQIRPEFSRTIASIGWSYQWNRRNRHRHRWDLFDVSYIYMPYRSQTFIDYLDQMDRINPLLRYSYENQLIAKMGYSFTYSSVAGTVLQASRRNSHIVRFSVEEAGNLLYLGSKWVNHAPKEGEAYQLANINFAQYIKADAEYTENYWIDERNALVFHAGLGIAYPYGNSKILPFEKLYFSGGANSVRGWSVRSLGPGSYAGSPNAVDYVNHTGELKLDINLEYRTHLFWKINGAIFADAGNVWNLRYRDHQPEGYFRFKNMLKQMAVAYGVGLRFDFDFLVIRFDGGMKAINPMFSGKDRFPIIRPNLGRDFAFHFAVGYPF